MLRDSEDAEGEMSIETYLYRCDAYRSTTVSGIPNPLKAQPSPEVEAGNSHASVVGHTVMKSGYPGGDNPLRVVHVLLPNDIPAPTELCQIRNLIEVLFKRRDTSIDVGIVDLELTFRPVICPISPENPLVHAFEKARGVIVSILEESLASDWCLLAAFYLPHDNGKLEPAVTVLFIHGHGRTDRNWNSLSRLKWYVVRGADAASDPSDDQTHMDRWGSKPSDPITSRPEMEYAVAVDVRTTLKDIEALIGSLASDIDRANDTIEQRLLMGEAPRPRAYELLEITKTRLDEAKKERKIVNTMPHPMGESCFHLEGSF